MVTAYYRPKIKVKAFQFTNEVYMDPDKWHDWVRDLYDDGTGGEFDPNKPLFFGDDGILYIEIIMWEEDYDRWASLGVEEIVSGDWLVHCDDGEYRVYPDEEFQKLYEFDKIE